MDNLSDGINMILNVIWDRNREMSVDELTEAVGAEFHRKWEKDEVQKFADYLVKTDYIMRKRHKLRPYYIAIGADYEL